MKGHLFDDIPCFFEQIRCPGRLGVLGLKRGQERGPWTANPTAAAHRLGAGLAERQPDRTADGLTPGRDVPHQRNVLGGGTERQNKPFWQQTFFGHFCFGS